MKSKSKRKIIKLILPTKRTNQQKKSYEHYEEPKEEKKSGEYISQKSKVK